LDVLSCNVVARFEEVNRTGSGVVQFVYLHHVFDDELEGLLRLLAFLKTYYRFVSYSEAVELLRSDELHESVCTISFDDGFSCALSRAQILKDEGISAMYFVCPRIVDNAVDYNFLTHYCREQHGLPLVEHAGWGDLETAVSMGHEIGAHTLSHSRLTSISADQAVEEIAKSREQVRRYLGDCKHFAWPYGRFDDFSSMLSTKVFEAGFDSCASIERGSHAPDPGDYPICIHRDHLMANWSLKHAMYFLNRSARSPLSHKESWPANWY
jgi:peptidoglycan/xylan/chitin deacetylase (PgdA/CDA1 family)